MFTDFLTKSRNNTAIASLGSKNTGAVLLKVVTVGRSIVVPGPMAQVAEWFQCFCLLASQPS